MSKVGLMMGVWKLLLKHASWALYWGHWDSTGPDVKSAGLHLQMLSKAGPPREEGLSNLYWLLTTTCQGPGLTASECLT